MIDIQKARLLGTKCVVNISQKPQKTGIEMVSTDPRKWRIKPDAYVGIVEKTGPRCEIIQTGDRVVIERWQYKQADIDDERLIADESQVLVVQRKKIARTAAEIKKEAETGEASYEPEVPAPGVVVIKLHSQLPKTQLALPDHVVKRERKKTLMYVGTVTDSGSVTAKRGDILWVERRERHQFLTPDGRLMFINCQDSWGEYPIWMKGEKVAKPLEVVK